MSGSTWRANSGRGVRSSVNRPRGVAAFGARRRYNSPMFPKVSVAAWACAAAFAASTTPSLDDALNMKSAGGAQISPDGRYVAYSVRQANWDENDFVSQIWIAVPASGERYQLTSGKKGAGNPIWSPDSRRLAFTSDRDGKRQIYVISPS